MNRPSTRSLLRLAAAGALLAALGLGGCGRKGGLDPPPGGTSLAPGPVADTAPQAGVPAQPGVPPQSAVMPDGKPLSPQGPRRPTIIDFLID